MLHTGVPTAADINRIAGVPLASRTLLLLTSLLLLPAMACLLLPEKGSADTAGYHSNRLDFTHNRRRFLGQFKGSLGGWADEMPR